MYAIGSSIFGVVCLIERMYGDLLRAYGDVVMSSVDIGHTTRGYCIMSSMDSMIVTNLYEIMILSCKKWYVSSVLLSE